MMRTRQRKRRRSRSSRRRRRSKRNKQRNGTRRSIKRTRGMKAQVWRFFAPAAKQLQEINGTNT